MSHHPELAAGTRLGRYVIVRTLGRGGMGTVYLADDTRLRRQVALKLPHVEKLDAVGRERFLREARIAAGIPHHAHLSPVHDADFVDGVPFLTMPFIEGRPLNSLLAEGNPLPVARVVEVMTKVAEAVAHLHRHDIIHRDLKPGNVMIQSNGEPLLMDFGLARSLEAETERLTRSNAAMGTPAFMAPEQFMDASKVGPAADIFALGTMLYELLTQRLPFAAMLNTPPPLPSSVRPGVDARFDALCLRAMRKEARQRHGNVGEFLRELNAIAPHAKTRAPTAILLPTIPPVGSVVRQESDTVTAGVPKPSPISTGFGRKKALWIAGSLMLLAFFVVISGLLSGKKPEVESALPREITNGTGMKLVLIRAGKFLMGSPGDEGAASERPQHEVEITRDFYMGTTEVTVGQFRRFIDKTDAVKAGVGSMWQKNADSSPDNPVVFVSWIEAEAFCNWLSNEENKVYGLPTEAEWEYACRAGSQGAFCFGNDATQLTGYGWFLGNFGGKHFPVGLKKPNSWGLYDMHGNVWEWCQDAQRSYADTSIKDPAQAPGGRYRVLRGGWWGVDADQCRSANRSQNVCDGRFETVGFRVACRPSVKAR